MIGGSNKMITTLELSERLGIPTRTLQANWRKYGIPAYRVGKHLRFRERDVDAWLEKNRAE